MGAQNAWLSNVATEPGGPLEGVPVCEEFNTRKEVFAATAFEAEVILRCPWAYRFLVVWDIYQNNVYYPDNVDAFVSGWTIAPDMQKPYDVYLDLIQYQDALITLKYSTAEKQSQQLFVQSFEPALENQVLRNTDYFWWEGGSTKPRTLTPKESPAKLFVMWNYTVMWLQQQVVPVEFFSLAGCVNQKVYQMKDVFPVGSPENENKLPIGSMLFQPGKITPSVYLKLIDGGTPADEKRPASGYDYTLKFTVNRIFDTQAQEYIGVWNAPFRSDATVPANNTNPAANYQGIWKYMPSGPSERTVIYTVKDFPVYAPDDPNTPVDTRFLPPAGPVPPLPRR